jgi:hypothetical protein
MESPGADTECVPADGFEVGDPVVADEVSADLFEVTTVSPGDSLLNLASSGPKNDPVGHSEWPAGVYPAGSRAVKVSQITLKTKGAGGLRLPHKANNDTLLAQSPEGTTSHQERAAQARQVQISKVDSGGEYTTSREQ